jgi:hypothetical protein
MKKVFIVFKEMDYADIVIAVYASEEAARQHAMQNINFYYDDFEVKE